MTDEEVMVKGFKVIWKVLGQVRPGITPEERFDIALKESGLDKLERAKRLNLLKLKEFKGEGEKPIFSDALTRPK